VSCPSSIVSVKLTITRAHEWDRLNEKTILFRSIMMFSYPFIQTLYHLTCDLDQIEVPTHKTSLKPKSIRSLPSTKDLAYDFKSLITKTLLCVPIGFMAYIFLVGGIIRRANYWLANYLFFQGLRSANKHSLEGFWSCIWDTCIQGFLLLTLWTLSNRVFTFYVSDVPLKSENPITNDSKDPNGSLLVGLKSKALIPKVG
jgi:nucleoporin NDC1